MRAKKSLGQNFLRDRAAVGKIVNALELGEGDTVVEIGPGHGALTEELLATKAHVIAIELDSDLIGLLRAKYADRPNLSVVEGNVLDLSFSSVIGTAPSAKLVGNLPYYISTAILQKLAADRQGFSRMVLMFQREVVERITAGPGGRERGYLSVIVENAFAVRRLFDVPPEAFTPQPKVWSAVVEMMPKPFSANDVETFRKIVGLGFAQKRKTLLNNLRVRFRNAAEILAKTGIDGRRRAETLTLAEWAALTDAFLSDDE